jgi:hypothetical protein
MGVDLRKHPFAFVWELTEETIHLPLGCLQGGVRLTAPRVGRAYVLFPDGFDLHAPASPRRATLPPADPTPRALTLPLAEHLTPRTPTETRPPVPGLEFRV